MLQGILARAVEWNRLDTNPVKLVSKPTYVRERAIRALPPADIERLRRHFIEEGRMRDATLVSVLAYAGPRPGEVLSAPLLWEDIFERTLLLRQPKTKKPQRVVGLLRPLRQDLAEWRLLQGRPGPKEPVFPAHDGGAWDRDDYANWRKRVFKQKGVDCVGIDLSRPYDLRHSFASLLIHEGRMTIVEIADQLGHSTQTLLANYAHIIAELSGEQLSAEEQIRRARDDQAAHMRPASGVEPSG
jgi:integrase